MGHKPMSLDHVLECLLAHQPFEGLQLREGRVRPSAEPGLGVRPA